MAGFYDLDEVKSIPILDVCDFLGMDVQRMGRVYWCKLRPDENHASCQLNIEGGSKPDWFYDHGSHVGGDVIKFAMECMGCGWQEALDSLAGAFGIASINNSQYMNRNELSDHEWKKLGIHGDLATKNLHFDFDKYSIESVKKYSEMYAMPVNQLRKEHPAKYTRDILRNRAIPAVYKMRNTYYFTLYCNMATQKAVIGKFELAKVSKEDMDDMESLCRQVTQAEALLKRALKGTDIRYSFKEYNVLSDLKKIHYGEIAFEIGDKTYSDVKREAWKYGSTLQYRSMPFNDYLSLSNFGVDSILHAAFLKGDQVNLAFLPEQAPLIDKCIERYEKDKALAQIQDVVAIEYKGVVFDNWTVDAEGNACGVICERCAEKYKDMLGEDLLEGSLGVCSVKGCDAVTEGSRSFTIAFDPKFIRPLDREQVLADEVKKQGSLAENKEAITKETEKVSENRATAGSVR